MAEFVRKVAPGYEGRFEGISGNKMATMDPNAVMRQCGGRWSCAAFSSRLAEDAAGQSVEEAAAEREAAEQAEAAGRLIYEEFYQAQARAKRQALGIPASPSRGGAAPLAATGGQ